MNISFPQEVDSVDAIQSKAIKIFLDCNSCDKDFIRTEITFVNYVRDRTQADVHVLITTQETGSGGKEYSLTFIGQNAFENKNDTLHFTTKPSATSDER